MYEGDSLCNDFAVIMPGSWYMSVFSLWCESRYVCVPVIVSGSRYLGVPVSVSGSFYVRVPVIVWEPIHP